MPKSKPVDTSNLWYGSDESHSVVLLAQNQVKELMAAGDEVIKTTIKMRGGGKADDPFALPSLWDVQNGVGVVNISGSLINGNAGFMRLFGVLGYGDIADALMEAAASKDVKQIMLAIDSGGGSVNGVGDLGALIEKIDQTMKPILSYTDGGMLSAAYRTGAAAQKIISSDMAQVGSVGTLIVHTEYSKQLEAAGIKKTIVKAGKFKAAGNPYEPLSKEAEAQMQDLVNEANRLFVAYVADRRGVTPEQFQKTMGEGRVFMGQQAMDVGLTDHVMTFADAIVFAKTLDNAKPGTHNPRNRKDSTMKAALSQKTLLAIASGAALTALNLSALDANAEGVQLDAAALAALTAEATALIAARDIATAAAVTASGGTAVAAAVTTATAEIQGKLTKAETDLQAAAAKVALLEAGSTALTGQVTAANTMAAGYAGVVKASLSVMSVALGGTKDHGASLVGDALLAEHTQMREKFVAKFPAGGVAAVNTEHTPENKPAGPSALFRSLVRPVTQ